MKRERAMAILLAGGLTLLPAARAVVSAENPYSGIVERNPFDLVPIPPPAPVVTTAPPSNIQLTGITKLMGKKLAMLMALEPGPNKTPQSYMLTEGQRDGEIEVLEIDDKVGSVKINNAGVPQTLTFDKDGAKPAGGPAGAPGPGGGPLRMPNGLPMPIRPGATPNPNVGGLRQIPTRDMRTASAPATPPASATTATPSAMSINGRSVSFGGQSQPAHLAQPELPTMTGDEQTMIIEVNRVVTQPQVDAGELPPLPITELTPPEAVTPVPGQ